MNWSQPLILSLLFCVCCRSITITWPVYLPRLQASNCDDKRCPAPVYRDEYIEYCGYKCPMFHKFICEEDEQMNVIEYCLHVDLICEPGYYVTGYIDPDDATKVIVKKLPCPEGTYKQFTNHCIDQCRKQESEDFLPEMFALHEKGNYKEPAKVVCDHHKNYFTKTEKFWFYHDPNFTHNYRHLCVLIIDNPCPSGERPLKDGSCVCGIVECLSENNTTSGSTSLLSTEQPKPASSMSTPGTSHQDTWIHVVGIVSAIIIISIAVLLGLKIYSQRQAKHVTKNIYGDSIAIGNVITYQFQSIPLGTSCTDSEGENGKNDENDTNNNESGEIREIKTVGPNGDCGNNDDSNN